MDIPLILMYSFFAIVNVKIFLSIGIIAYFKRVYKQSSLKNLSQLLVNSFLPIYGVIEVSRMATPANMQVFWIMVLSVLFSMVIGYYSGKLCQYLFKLDLRIENSYALLCCLPSIGTLPLVLGKAFCYPGGPLDGDPQCSNILGYMMINFLIFQISLFLIGFQLIAKDANFGYLLDDKMSLTWHIIVEKLYKRDYWVLYLFRKYFKDTKLADSAFDEFEKNHVLRRVDGEITYYLNGNNHTEYNHEEFQLPEKITNTEAAQANPKKVAFINDHINENQINNPLDPKHNKLKNSFKNIRTINLNENESFNNEISSKKMNDKRVNFNDKQDQLKDEKSLLSGKDGKNYFESRVSNSVEGSQIYNNEIKNSHELESPKLVFKKMSKNNLYFSQNDSGEVKLKKIQPLVVDDFKIDSESNRKFEISDFEVNIKKFQSDIYDTVLIDKRPQNKYARENSIQIEISKNNFINHSERNLLSEKIHEEIHEFLLHKKKGEIIKPDLRQESEFYFPEINPKNFKLTKKEELAEKIRIHSTINENNKIVSMRLIKHQEIFSDVISNYYQKAFSIIENNVNPALIDNFLLEKSEVMKNIHDIPPKFPIARGIEVRKDNIKQIEAIWDDYLVAVKKLNPDFDMHPKIMKADISLIINKIHSPAVVGTILGLVVGVSGMREILFSTNHYISNLVDGIYIITKVTVPFLYVTVGFSFVTIDGFTLNLPVSKRHVYLSILIRFLIVPGFGLLWTWLWTEYYGGIIKQSKVFRISLFIPFCVPSSANLIIITNLLKYFIAEANLILVFQNLTVLFTMTIIYLIYFVVIGGV